MIIIKGKSVSNWGVFKARSNLLYPRGLATPFPGGSPRTDLREGGQGGTREMPAHPEWEKREEERRGGKGYSPPRRGGGRERPPFPASSCFDRMRLDPGWEGVSSRTAERRGWGGVWEVQPTSLPLNYCVEKGF